MVSVARSFVRAFLGSNPHAQDAELIMSEYVTNAIRYTACASGAIIHISVAATARTVRVEVADPGPPGPANPPVPPTAGHGGLMVNGADESGRGFLIVDALATRWGHFGIGGGQLTAWAEFGEPAAEGSAPGDG
jgi:anti-sigma regulatory factor (Ser/Thr protein kinase)